MSNNYSQSDLEAFIRVHNGYGSNTLPKKRSSNRGVLKYVCGAYEEVIQYDKPFALLNHIRNKMINEGYKKNHLIIVSL